MSHFNSNSSNSSNNISEPSTPSSSHNPQTSMAPHIYHTNPNMGYVLHNTNPNPNTPIIAPWGMFNNSTSPSPTYYATPPHPNRSSTPNFVDLLSQSQNMHGENFSQSRYDDFDSQSIPNTQKNIPQHVITNLFGDLSQLPSQPPTHPPTHPPTQPTTQNKRGKGKKKDSSNQRGGGDDDVEELEGPKRQSNFRVEEDTLLVKMWLKVSEDDIVGKEQTRGTFWEKVENEFMSRTTLVIKRTSKALEGRFRTLQTHINHYAAIIAQVDKDNGSGRNEADRVKIASNYLNLVKDPQLPSKRLPMQLRAKSKGRSKSMI
ncbi:hypothetical protein ACHQM5_017085 [Ranunculus cassubicifolius]